MGEKKIIIEKPCLFVVEGREEELFFEALLEHFQLSDIQILPIGGKTKLRMNLGVLVKTPGFYDARALGICRDADTDPQAAFQSVCDALRSFGLPAPNQPLEIVGTALKVSVMILPDGIAPGALEDICLRAIAQDLVIPCIDQYLTCIQHTGLPTPHPLAKARIQVFLASREEPGKRLGEAAQAGYLPFGDPAFSQIIAFLHLLTV